MDLTRDGPPSRVVSNGVVSMGTCVYHTSKRVQEWGIHKFRGTVVSLTDVVIWFLNCLTKGSVGQRGQLEHGGKKSREGVKSGIGRLELMKHGNGIKVRDDRSIGIDSTIEILMTDTFGKINPTDPIVRPLRLVKHVMWRKRNWSSICGKSLVRVDDWRWVCQNSRRLKSS